MDHTDVKDLKAQQQKLHHVSEHLANERTMLAWTRTAIAVMTLGVGINRFNLFMVEFSHVVAAAPPTRMPSNWASAWWGSACS